MLLLQSRIFKRSLKEFLFKISNKEKELLAAEKRIVGYDKDFSMALATAERKLAELYQENKDKDLSNADKVELEAMQARYNHLTGIYNGKCN